MWKARSRVASHRVLLLDQRGTGRSSRVSTSALAKLDGGVDASAAHLALFRADSIVADAECVRKTLLGPGDDAKWALLGQSFGGFCIARYLSVAAESVSEAFLTGGLPPLVHEANAAARGSFYGWDAKERKPCEVLSVREGEVEEARVVELRHAKLEAVAAAVEAASALAGVDQILLDVR